jgi:putative Mg2+ transporter-C (MgtC) family protein
MDHLWHKVVLDFSDLPDFAEAIRMAVRLIMAAVLGGILGYDRERIGKSAGLRTHMLVALAAALFVLIPQQAGMTDADISRVIQGILAGIGFLGAGAILRGSNDVEVRGLTTAAGIWLTAAIGIAAGLGREASAILGTALAYLILSTLPQVIDRFKKNKPSKAGPVVPPSKRE